MGCGASAPKPLTIEEIIAGLKDTLKIAVRLACTQMGAEGAFENSPDFHVPIPTALGEMMAKLVDVPLMGDKIKEFEHKLNDAAEKSVKAAVEVFVGAINAMDFKDAKAILEGPPTGATQFFQEILSDDLKAKFRPIVEDCMKDNNLASLFDTLIKAYKGAGDAAGAVADAVSNLNPFANKEEKKEEEPEKEVPDVDLADFISNKGLDGLWAVLAQKEEMVRGSGAHHETEAMKRCYAQKTA